VLGLEAPSQVSRAIRMDQQSLEDLPAETKRLAGMRRARQTLRSRLFAGKPGLGEIGRTTRTADRIDYGLSEWAGQMGRNRPTSDRRLLALDAFQDSECVLSEIIERGGLRTWLLCRRPRPRSSFQMSHESRMKSRSFASRWPVGGLCSRQASLPVRVESVLLSGLAE
jgi:hypothetical protein